MKNEKLFLAGAILASGFWWFYTEQIKKRLGRTLYDEAGNIIENKPEDKLEQNKNTQLEQQPVKSGGDSTTPPTVQETGEPVNFPKPNDESIFIYKEKKYVNDPYKNMTVLKDEL